MNTELNIYKGNEINLPSSFEEGSVYVCVDTGNVYADLNNKKILLTHLQKTAEGGYKIDEAGLAHKYAVALGQGCKAGGYAYKIKFVDKTDNTVILEGLPSNLQSGMKVILRLRVDDKNFTTLNATIDHVEPFDEELDLNVLYYLDDISSAPDFVNNDESLGERGLNILQVYRYSDEEKPSNMEMKDYIDTVFAHNFEYDPKYRIAIGESSISVGLNNQCFGMGSFSAGTENVLFGRNTVVFGKKNILTGDFSFATGNHNIIETTNSYAGGYGNIIKGESSFVIGNKNIINGVAGFTIGQENIINGYRSMSNGKNNKVIGQNAIAIGNTNQVQLENSGAFGVNNIISSVSCTDKTDKPVNNSANCFAFGSKLIVGRPSSGGQVGIGTYIGTISSTDAPFYKSTDLLGFTFHTTKNIATINTAGAFSGTAAKVAGADYAEYFEWEDGNPNNEDRRGRFVALIEDKICLATQNSDIVGIVSAAPGAIGNGYDLNWQGRYLRDEFGAILYHDEIIDEEGNTEYVPIENPDFDATQEYIARSDRKEWDMVGLIGQLIMLHDGTCEVGGYCAPGVDGIATASLEKTNCRVMKRIDDTHILVLLK